MKFLNFDFVNTLFSVGIIVVLVLAVIVIMMVLFAMIKNLKNDSPPYPSNSIGTSIDTF